MKPAAEVGLGEIFQKPFGICFPNFGLRVSGEVPFRASKSVKILFLRRYVCTSIKINTLNILNIFLHRVFLL